MNEDEFEDTLTSTPSPFISPYKEGGNGKNKVESLAPVATDPSIGTLAKSNDSTSTTTIYEACTVLEATCYYNLTNYKENEAYHAENEEVLETSGKPRSPENVSDCEDEDDEVDGTKTLEEPQPVAGFDDDTGHPNNDKVNAEVVQLSQKEYLPNNFRDQEECGWQSPASSQGSLKSSDYLFNNIQKIEDNAAQTRRTSELLDNILPKDLYNLIQNYLADEHSEKRLLSFIMHDIMPTSFYTGACQRGSEQAKRLEKDLECQNKNVIWGVIGRTLMKKFEAHIGHSLTTNQNLTTANAFEPEQMETEEQIELNAVARPCATESGRQLTTELFENGQSALTANPCSDNQVYKREQTACSVAAVKTTEESIPDVPNYLRVADAGSTAVASTTKPKTPRENMSVYQISDKIPNDAWEFAIDQLQENDSNKNKQIEKVGQVIFDATFTNEEKKTCSYSGKGKNSTLKIFDKWKVRFVKLAVAFILTKPNKRTTKSFRKAISDPNFKELDQNEWTTLKKKVFNEYAYRQRPRNANQ